MKLRHIIRPVLTILALAGAFSAYGAWYRYVGMQSATAVDLATQIQAAKQSGTRAEQAKRELERATTEELSIQGYFVNTNEVVPFLESLQTTGTRLGTKVTVVSVSSLPSKPHAQLQLSVTITGSFDAVERTLGTIEYQPYDTQVKTLTFDTPRGGEVPVVWTAAVTMLVGTVDASSTPARPVTVPTSSPSSTIATSTSAVATTTSISASSSTTP